MKSLPLPLTCVFVLLLALCTLGQNPKKPVAKGAASPIAISAGTTKCVGNGLTQTEMNEILLSHNRVRASVGLKPLTWDCRIGSAAQGWANAGVAGHNGETFFGENIFVASNGGESAALAADQWAAERSDWTNKPPACSAGKKCTHFTQMVWRQTTRMGCGINRNAPGKWKVILVCNYDVEAGSGSAY